MIINKTDGENASGHIPRIVVGISLLAILLLVSNAGAQPQPTFSITGTVFVDINQNGIQDNGEKGYSGATITLNTGQPVTTDANGNYAFVNLLSGTYVEALTVPGGYTATTPSSVTITLNGNAIQNFGIVQTTITPTQPIPSPGSISGYKIDATTGMGIPNWKIKLNGIIGLVINIHLPIKETTTNDQGFYKFDNLPAGRYMLTEETKQGYVPVGSFVKNIQLAPGEDSKNNNFTNSNLLEKIAPPTPVPITPVLKNPILTPFSCSDAPLTFPISSIDNSGGTSFIGWLYKEPTFGWGQKQDDSVYHSGLDFWTSPDTPVLGQATGKVIRDTSKDRGWTINYTNITYLGNDGIKKTGNVYVYIDNLVDGNIDGKTVKVLKEGDDVVVGEIIGFMGTANGVLYKKGRNVYHIHWSVSPEDRTDQKPIPYPGYSATQLDPTSLLTPNGNLNANGERIWYENELSWWCDHGVGKEK